MTKPYVETIEEQEGRMSRVKGNDPRGSKRLTLVRGKKIQDMDQELKSIFVVEDSKNQPTGTQALMLAILEDGIRSYLSQVQHITEEAEHWVNLNRRSPFSFVVVCETLDLDPAKVREALKRMRDKHTSK
ncbi:hypothetical protein A3D60_02585 [Candidatus Uhrbacteria bacterium RIFCSPHIGHO2_02_FULL_47_29]|nr:MAG: hypothetical protein A3D60_02585 [Candidatus Uhrbacteria bacterium RIFCSPHIGHO2_02_FULL_47_29]